MKTNPNPYLRWAGVVLMVMGLAQIVMGVLLITGAVTQAP